MTFTEAALQVLRSASEPLHYKKIVELAIARNLLSHVGRTPEVTMSSRLATLVKKDRGQSVVVKVRPGVFAIRESSMTEKEAPLASAADESTQSPAASLPPKVQLPGADVFPEEEGDDDPILAGIEEGAGQEGDRGRRKRRRRRGRGGDRPEGAEAPREGGEPLREGGPREGGPREGGPREGGSREGGPRDEANLRGNPPDRGRDRGRDDRGGRDRDRGRDDRGRDRDRGRDDRGRDRDRGRDDRGRDRDRGRDDRFPEEARPPIELTRTPGEGDLLGKDLADAAYSVLSNGDRQSASFARVAEMLVRRGRLNGAPDVLAPTVAAAVRGDIARASRSGRRARFRIVEQRVTLSDWLLPREALGAEDQALQAAERQRDQVRRAFVSRLNDLPTGGFAELVATWLNAEGVTGLRAVRRPTSSGRELHFAGTLRRGAEETRIAFVVLRAGLDIEAAHVIDVRGSLHHYGSAHQAWLVTTGRVAPPARDEGAAENAAPCALLSGGDLARSMERLGIGLRTQTIALCDIDFELLEALGDAGLRRDRDRERSRERDEQQQRAREQQRSRPSEGEGERDEGAGQPREVVAPEIDLLDPELAEQSRLGGGEWEEGQAAQAAEDAPDSGEEDVELDFDRDEPAEEIDDGSDDSDESDDTGDEDDEAGDANGDANGDADDEVSDSDDEDDDGR